MYFLLVGLALAADPVSQDRFGTPDVVAEATLQIDPTMVTERLSDLAWWSEHAPDSCYGAWSLGASVRGPEARARVTVRPSWMRRRLTVVVREVRPGALVDLEFLGPKGFTTRVKLEPEEQDHVVMTTFMNPAPWPLREIYHQKVKPAWMACQQGVLHAVMSSSEASD